MEDEENHSWYKPSQKKEVKNLTDQEIFENNLNKALEQDEKDDFDNGSYAEYDNSICRR